MLAECWLSIGQVAAEWRPSGCEVSAGCLLTCLLVHVGRLAADTSSQYQLIHWPSVGRYISCDSIDWHSVNRCLKYTWSQESSVLLYFEKAMQYSCLATFSCFLHQFDWHLCRSSSMFRFIHLLLVLAPHDSIVAVYVKCCWLSCMLYIPLLALGFIHISDFIAALAICVKSWNLDLFPKPFNRITEVILPTN